MIYSRFLVNSNFFYYFVNCMEIKILLVIHSMGKKLIRNRK